MNDKLKPCPFCGKAPFLGARVDEKDKITVYVSCEDCGVQIAYIAQRSDVEFEQVIDGKEKAVTAWNRRAE